jgi:hypothetical protein
MPRRAQARGLAAGLRVLRDTVDEALEDLKADDVWGGAAGAGGGGGGGSAPFSLDGGELEEDEMPYFPPAWFPLHRSRATEAPAEAFSHRRALLQLYHAIVARLGDGGVPVTEGLFTRVKWGVLHCWYEGVRIKCRDRTYTVAGVDVARTERGGAGAGSVGHSAGSFARGTSVGRGAPTSTVGGGAGGRALSTVASPRHGAFSVGSSPRHGAASYSLASPVLSGGSHPHHGAFSVGGGGDGGGGRRGGRALETLQTKLMRATMRQLQSLVRLYKDGGGGRGGGGGGDGAAYATGAEGDSELIRRAYEARNVAAKRSGELAAALSGELSLDEVKFAAAELRRTLVGVGAAAWGNFAERAGLPGGGAGDFALEPVNLRPMDGNGVREDEFYGENRLLFSRRVGGEEEHRAARDSLKRAMEGAIFVDPFTWVLRPHRPLEGGDGDDGEDHMLDASLWYFQNASAKKYDEQWAARAFTHGNH